MADSYIPADPPETVMDKVTLELIQQDMVDSYIPADPPETVMDNVRQEYIDKSDVHTILFARFELIQEWNKLQKHCARFIHKTSRYRELTQDNMSPRINDKLSYVEERVRFLSLQSPPT